tara:strand:+ start:4699 stop:5277 length:579 start_codon:yes stop_codon:yes gene_type:complete
MKQNNRTIYTMSGVVLVFHVLLVGAILFIFVDLSERSTKAAQLSGEVALQNSSEGNYFTLKKTIEGSIEEINTIDSYFIKNETETVQLLEKIEYLANTLSIIATINIDVGNYQSDAMGSLPAIRLRIGAEGSFVKIYQFLTLIENLPYKIVVSETSIRRSSEARTIGAGAFTGSRWSMDISASVVGNNEVEQ